MEVKDLINYRSDLFDESRDEDGLVSETSFIRTIIPFMVDAKLLDNDDFTETFFEYDSDGQAIKINGYIINESGERLQIFILNNESIKLNNLNLQISQKDYYDQNFKKAFNFLNKAIKGHLNDIPDIGAVNALINQLSSSSGADQYDVIEVFLVSATATVNTIGPEVQPKRMDFKDDRIKIRFTKERQSKDKEILILRRLIDLNFLYSVLLSQGNREILEIDFSQEFNYKLEAIKAADEENFESYLCVLPATILAELYKKYSSRLLEKNVRSFLQFRGVNQGIRRTIQKEPEKFIAYNNGLTITASNKEFESVNGKFFIKSLTDFQIVNGGQTTASIYFSQKDGIDVSKVKVMTKINVIKNISEEKLNDLISSISEYSNSQTKVTSVDLRSRSPQLNKIKTLSESIITPSGRKWFFEKSKGEFNTKLRIAGSNGKIRIEKEYPREYRFTKELLGKYYCSWGDEPHMVKRGGEAIFRKFLEKITSEEKGNIISIDRNFFELLISKIILFKGLEKVHGDRKNALGQLRSAVVPYAISVIYSTTEGNKNNPNTFNLFRLWSNEGIEEDLSVYMKDLMSLMYALIKKYSKSDDLAEYSRKEELWKEIIGSSEVKQFLSTENSQRIIKKYSMPKKEFKDKIKGNQGIIEVDFKYIKDCVQIISKPVTYYSNIRTKLYDELTNLEKDRLSTIATAIDRHEELSPELVQCEWEITQKVKLLNPDLLESSITEKTLLEKTIDFIIMKYNTAIESSEKISTVFDKVSLLAESKGVKYGSVFTEMGKGLIDGKAPTLKQIYYASFYVNTLARFN